MSRNMIGVHTPIRAVISPTLIFPERYERLRASHKTRQVLMVKALVLEPIDQVRFSLEDLRVMIVQLVMEDLEGVHSMVWNQWIWLTKG